MVNSRHRALARARDLEHALEHALARDRDRDLARDLCHVYRALERDRDRALGHARYLARYLARDLARTRDLALDLALDRARDLVRDLAHELERARRRAHRWDLAHELERARVYTRDLVLTLEVAVDQLAQDGERTGSRQVIQPGRSAAMVTRWALRWLPVVERARYQEELFAELYDLAESGVSRRAQLGHALRLSTRGWSLRRALRAPSPAEERVR